MYRVDESLMCLLYVVVSLQEISFLLLFTFLIFVSRSGGWRI